jgi:hypothetical protein
LTMVPSKRELKVVRKKVPSSVEPAHEGKEDVGVA